MAVQGDEEKSFGKSKDFGIKIMAGESCSFGDDDEHTPKARKAYTITRQRQRWAEDEHSKFLEALKLYGRSWRLIQEHIGTKTAVQIRSHAQKFFSKVIRDSSICRGGGGPPGNANLIEIPPPRPKRKPKHPYPRKMATAPNSLSVCEQDHYQQVASSSISSLPNGSNSDCNPAPKNGESSPPLREDNHTDSSMESTTSSIKLFGRTVLVTDSHRPSMKRTIPTPTKEIPCPKLETSASTVSCLASNDWIPMGGSEAARSEHGTTTEITDLTTSYVKTTSNPSEFNSTGDFVENRGSDLEQNGAEPRIQQAEGKGEPMCSWNVWGCYSFPLYYYVEQPQRWAETAGMGARPPWWPSYVMVEEPSIPVNAFNRTDDEGNRGSNEASGKENNERSSSGSNESQDVQRTGDLIVNSLSRQEEKGISLQPREASAQLGCGKEASFGNEGGFIRRDGCISSKLGNGGPSFTSSGGGFVPYKRCAAHEPVKKGNVEDELREEKRVRVIG